MSHVTVARQAHAMSPGNTLPVRVGVIGLGRMGSDHVRRMKADIGTAQVVAACDLDARARELHESSYGIQTFADAAAMLEGAELDGVIIASPGEFHVEHVLACLDRDLPVLCEKPLAPTVTEGMTIVDAEAARGLRLIQLGFMRRFDEQLTNLVTAVQADAAGTPLLVHCVHRNPAVRPTYVSENSLNDSLTHEIDLLRWMLDDEVVAVRVLTPRSTPNASHLDDPKLILLEMASGVIADVEMYVNARYGYEVRCEVVGSEGTLSTSLGNGPVLRRSGTVSQQVEENWGQRFSASYTREVNSWADGIRSGIITGPSAWDGLVSSQVATAAVDSYRTGERIEVEILSRPAVYS